MNPEQRAAAIVESLDAEYQRSVRALRDDLNVFLATGHEGLGISTSLATARLIADEMLERVSAITRAPYSPTRSSIAPLQSY